MKITIRTPQMQDHDRFSAIMDQVQQMHVDWRPDEAYRGKGIGHQFFDKVKQLKAEKGCDTIELQVNAKNKMAYEMYRNYGFTEKSINMELK